ncbi:hypothetical protein L226DRAFT_573055 [Lentinus tigrinus ALCF2SS1-7]|uniref:Uncharacterized protein n=1 Tax=Lentinus tigrinus ALCF2SS1-6 TaxID=1328759 RepID=A0A5C2RPL6_9APHY|nr:hypothetical protein L227DRAFT_616976 [Lentinus tigrinus ALCF2SS1-6]RPD72634.1 hypothetical protein L226DRAFT_573055 [Lentinus tigrinus ALCF2SS1-7]
MLKKTRCVYKGSPRKPPASLLLTTLTPSAMNFASCIYLRKDEGVPHLPRLPLADLALVVDGPTALQPFLLILPLDIVERVTAPKISGWLAALSGPSVEQADMTAEQRETILKIVCGFRVFVKRPTGVVTPRDWPDFTALLTQATTRVGPLDSAEKELDDVTRWLEARFPAHVFLPVYDHFEDPASTVNSEAKRVAVVAALAAMLDPRIRDALRDNEDESTGPATPLPPQDTPPSRGPSRRARKRAAYKASVARRASDGTVHAQAVAAEGAPVSIDLTPSPGDPAVTSTSIPSPDDATPAIPTHIPGTPIRLSQVIHPAMRSERARGKCPAATVETDDEADDAASEDGSVDSVPSLKTVSASDSEREEYVDDDDEYYDDD